MDKLEERLLKIYYDRVTKECPKAIESLDFVNSVIRYMYELYYDFHIKDIVKNDGAKISDEEILWYVNNEKNL